MIPFWWSDPSTALLCVPNTAGSVLLGDAERAVRVRSSPEHVMPAASKLPDGEIAQARNLAVECLAVRQDGSNPDTRHAAQDDGRSDLRGPCLLLHCTPMIW